MHLKINGTDHHISDNTTVAELIANFGITDRKIAVEVNQKIISASQFSQTQLAENDQVEIIHAVGGG